MRRAPWDSFHSNSINTNKRIEGIDLINRWNATQVRRTQVRRSMAAPVRYESEIGLETINDVDELTTEENLEYDIFIKMPPVKVRTARIRIKSIEKGTINIVEPE
jgi:hypothetical protein